MMPKSCRKLELCNLHCLAGIAVPLYQNCLWMIRDKSAENALQGYLSGILAYKGRCVTILSDNGMRFKNKILTETCNQLGIKRLFSKPFHPQGNAKVENVHKVLEGTLT